MLLRRSAVLSSNELSDDFVSCVIKRKGENRNEEVENRIVGNGLGWNVVYGYDGGGGK